MNNHHESLPLSTVREKVQRQWKPDDSLEQKVRSTRISIAERVEGLLLIMQQLIHHDPIARDALHIIDGTITNITERNAIAEDIAAQDGVLDLLALVEERIQVIGQFDDLQNLRINRARQNHAFVQAELHPETVPEQTIERIKDALHFSILQFLDFLRQYAQGHPLNDEILHVVQNNGTGIKSGLAEEIVRTRYMLIGIVETEQLLSNHPAFSFRAELSEMVKLLDELEQQKQSVESRQAARMLQGRTPRHKRAD